MRPWLPRLAALVFFGWLATMALLNRGLMHLHTGSCDEHVRDAEQRKELVIATLTTNLRAQAVERDEAEQRLRALAAREQQYEETLPTLEARIAQLDAERRALREALAERGGAELPPSSSSANHTRPRLRLLVDSPAAEIASSSEASASLFAAPAPLKVHTAADPLPRLKTPPAAAAAAAASTTRRAAAAAASSPLTQHAAATSAAASALSLLWGSAAADNDDPPPLERAKLPGGIPVLVFCYNRPDSLERTLRSLFKYQPVEGFPVLVSQDGAHDAVTRVIRSFAARPLFHMRFRVREELFAQAPNWNPSQRVYFRIAQHYGWALGQVFDRLGYEKAIIVEDDMVFAPDFFDYFAATAPLLDRDDTLLCVSAWNDNGVDELVSDPLQLYRTDCFPGLGWMLARRVWDELRPQWPGGYWDDWLRTPEVSRGRSCIFPEVNRVYTFGEEGASKGLFFDQLERIRLNTDAVDFAQRDLSYLLISNYPAYLEGLMQPAQVLPIESAAQKLRALVAGSGDAKSPVFVVRYRSLGEFDAFAANFPIMTDHKSGRPRASFRGIVGFRVAQKPTTQLVAAASSPLLNGVIPQTAPHKARYANGYRVFLVPSQLRRIADEVLLARQDSAESPPLPRTAPARTGITLV